MKSASNSTACLASVFLGLALAAVPAAVEAQVSLATVVDLAQRNSNTVKLADADVRKAQAVLAQAQDSYIPNLLVGSTVGGSIGFPTGQPSIANASSVYPGGSDQLREEVKDAALEHLADEKEEARRQLER